MGLAATLFVALAGLAWATVVVDDELYCELEQGDSNFGTVSWSLLPPGPKCTYTVAMNGLDRVEGPGPVTSIWVSALVMATGVLVATRDAR